MDGSYAWMIYIREKAHEAGKSLPAVAVVFFCRRHRSSFALSLRFRRVLELAGFSIGVLDRGRRLEQGSKTTFWFKIALASQPEESSRCFQHGGGYYQGVFLLAVLEELCRTLAPLHPACRRLCRMRSLHWRRR
ncbi:unnamed protein product [Sphagnum troendelagicum]